MNLRRLSIAILLALALTPAAARAADENEAYRKMMADQRKMMEKIVMARPELRPGQTVRMDELVRLTVADGKLTATSPLFEGAAKKNVGQMRVKVEGLDGWAMVMVQQVGGRPGGTGWYLSFSHTSYLEDGGQQNLNINAQPGMVSISRNSNSIRRNSNVSIQEVRNRPEFGIGDGVTLNVFEGDNRGRNPVSINLTAKDFAELRRKNAREVDQHLRPLLKDLRLEGLFTIEHAAAWQVFAAEWKRDDVMERQVKQLVTALDAEQYADREKAMSSLRAMGPDGALLLYHTLDRTGLSLEQVGRVDALIAAHPFLPRDQVAKLGADPEFLLDCMYSDEAAVRHVAAARLKRLGKDVEIDADAPRPARAAQIEAARRIVAPTPTTKQTATTKPAEKTSVTPPRAG
ncbi:MAG TPA: hypothetical protein VEA69_16335 [Tepidisphaeraceae bacterium]|nr:hypothetical protein [Tepidisphaeraceae bacterium]